MKKIGLYIHIPFCTRKCNYCDFISYENKNDCIEEYVNKLKEEIKEKLNNNEYILKTIYIGGGTPSFIDSKYIIDIMKTIKKNINNFDPEEVTIEINPGTVTKQKLIDYKIARY